MLKNFILLISISFANVVFAQSSSMDSCVASLKYYYLASPTEANLVCGKDSSAEFILCMQRRSVAPGRAESVVEAAPNCSRKRLNLPLEVNDSKTYTNFNSCNSRMQVYARMYQDRAIQICNYNPRPELQKCYIDLVQGANWHPELAIQYCGFAEENYPRQIAKFSSCVVNETRAGSQNAYRTAQTCHEKILFKPNTIKSQPEVEIKVIPQKPVEPYVVEKPVVVQAPQKQTGAGSVPTPVQIRVQESARPEVINDQPLDPGSTSNSESLPL